MAKKKEMKRMLSDYEINCMWMSYRYCIGRNTIATHSHAFDIACNCYNGLTDERMQFTAQDIRSEIYSILRFNDFYVYTSYCDDVDPMKMLFNCLQSLDIHTPEDLSKYSRLVAENGENGEIVFRGVTDGEPIKVTSFIKDIRDLMVWADLANYFDKKNYKTVRVNNNGKEEDIQLFDSYCFEDYDSLNMKHVYRPIEASSVNGNKYLDEKYIVK